MTARIEQVDIGVEDWIDGVSYTQIKVEIHRNPALWAELGPLYADVEAAEARLDEAIARAQHNMPTVDEAVLGSGPVPTVVANGDSVLADAAAEPTSVERARADLAAAEAAAEAVYARFDADKEVWTLQALDREVVEEITAEAKAQAILSSPPKRRDKESVASFDRRVLAYSQKALDVGLTVAEACISRATVSVVVAGVEKPAPSPEGVRRVRLRPHGAKHFNDLRGALESITLQDVVIPAPKSRKGSNDAPASS